MTGGRDLSVGAGTAPAQGALVGLGLHGLIIGAVDTLNKGGLIGKALAKVAGFIGDFLPFEPLGLLFLGLGFMLSLFVAISYE